MSFLGQEEQLRELQDRFRLLHIALFVGLGLLLSRLVYLQILNGDKMRHFSEENRIKRVKIPAPRGMILDRQRTILIDNHPAFDLTVVPQYLRESREEEKVLNLLSGLIDMPMEEIKETLRKSRGIPRFMPITLKTDLTRDEVAVIEAWKIDMPGVQVQEQIKRTNVYGDVASHLLGYIGEVSSRELDKMNKKNPLHRYKLGDSVGKYGLEQIKEDTLRGIDGERLVEVDAVGRTKLKKGQSRLLDKSPERPSIPGKNLILTIDQDLQLTAKEAFGDHVGSLVAIDPSTGEILAMISRPSFDPTEFSRGIPYALWKELINNPHRPLRDKTIQDHYPPGSVFKVVTAIAGLEEGTIDEKTKFHCPGAIRVGNRTYHCHKRGGHGSVDVVEALSKSCDVFFYRLAQKLSSVDDIAKWALHLGLGKKTGVSLSREVPGLIPSEEWKMKRFGQPWQAGESLSVAIGQSYVLITAIQMANLYASIANGGTLYRPFIVKRVESYEGQVLDEYTPEMVDQHRLAPKTYELIKQGLWGVMNNPEGTAYWRRLPGMDFVGKTGTVQVIRLSADKIYQKCEEMDYKSRHNAMFAGYAPAGDPKIAVGVIVEHGCSGSGTAAPIARAVVEKYLQKYFPEQYGPDAISEKAKEERRRLAAIERWRNRQQALEQGGGTEENVTVTPDQPSIPRGSEPDLESAASPLEGESE